MQKIETLREEQRPQADTTSLREHVQKQLDEVEKTINRLRGELEAAVDFRSRCLGGLETLQILDPVEETSEEDEEEDTTNIKLN